ncbi:hypothetical protein EWM64_g9460 [Hericium alpestre]|uniref:Uncharacterized protein n=1 Tax=Hericium alpestre TaxID=135208 RepID=A0A4Y9ZKW9_9AGAM|nr:hypothetical protein EWM64_g9460 [Hericium alpestre]
MVTVPSELNAGMLLRATNDQLRYWIEEANHEAERKALTMGMKKKKSKLAAYYGFDLSADVVPLPVGPLTIDTDIQLRQWTHLRSLGQEWREEAHAGRPFLLYTPWSDDDVETGNPRADTSQDGSLHLSLLQEIQQVLSSLKGLAACTGATGPPLEALLVPKSSTSASGVFPEGTHIANETAYALMGAALRGNVSAISDLQQLLVQRAGMVKHACRVRICTRPWHIARHLLQLISTAAGLEPCASNMAITSVLPLGHRLQHGSHSGTSGVDFDSVREERPQCATNHAIAAIAVCFRKRAAAAAHACELDSEASVLDACKAEVLALKKASGLRDVIKQVEAGVVQQMRDRYGPPVGHRGASSPTWDHVKGTVTRHERLYHQFKTEFGSDKDRFFGFFTLDTPRKHRQKGSSTDWDLRALRRVVEAIPWMLEDIEDEMELPEYVDPRMGTFSHELWLEKWGQAANTWEIWRTMGKERYVRLPKD